MAKQRNYLLGYGEQLAEPVDGVRGGGDKNPPYPFEEARERMTAMLTRTSAALNNLPAAACPGGQSVASFMLHPEYYAKTSYPGGFFQAVGLRAVGSRSRTITPDKRSPSAKGAPREPKEAVTTELFVAGARSSFEQLARELPTWTEVNSAAKHLTAFESVSGVDPVERIRPLPADQATVPLEIVLHAGESVGDRFVLQGFREYLRQWELDPDFERVFFAGRLCFLRMQAPPERAEDIARFSFLRVLREMPRLRITQPMLRGNLPGPRAVQLPAGDAIDPSLRVAVFDGGLPETSPLTAWADAFDAPGVGPSHPSLLWHGETVTSAVLFGSADAANLGRPYCKVDHYRVLDTNSENDPFELYEVLERITAVLDATPYPFFNLSIGPTLAIDDDDVHAWTAVLDERLGEGRCLATIAAGNTGEEPDNYPIQPWRVQVPSDCVNGLTVGASDRRAGEWNRAGYSSRGPGRSPGIVKPDLIAFGGSLADPFWVCSPGQPGQIVTTAGTSYAAPATLRQGTGVRAHFGNVLSPLAIKALLIHATEDGGHIRDDVGWGRLPDSLDDLVVCPDGCARIVYQDEINAAKYRRIRIPMPTEGVTGDVYITATFCFATEIDPEHSGNYTRSGLEIVFRPNQTKFDEDAVHPKSAEFFKPADLYPTEQELRRDAHKWETCLHRMKRKRSSGLDRPVFDIHYNARSEGHSDNAPRKIRYALVITVEAPKVKDFYDRVVRAYRNQLQPLSPVIEVPVRP
jgi:hypothetical protein